MVNMLKMDMYRLFKSKAFKVVLIIVVSLNLTYGPLIRLLSYISEKTASADSEPVVWERAMNFADIVKSPLGFFDNILILLSIVWFSHADLGHGYIKNIAGQLPQKGYTVISKFIVVGIQNLFLVLAAVIAQTIGYIPFKDINYTEELSGAIGYFWLKWLLMLAISAIILLFSSGFKSKTAATTTAVLMGGQILSLTYMLFSFGIRKIPLKFLKEFELGDYMPDSLMSEAEPPVVKSIIVSLVIISVFMTATINIFNNKDVN